MAPKAGMPPKAPNGGGGGANWLCCCPDEVSPPLWFAVELSACVSISITCSTGLPLVELVLFAELELSEDEASLEEAGVVSVTVEPSA